MDQCERDIYSQRIDAARGRLQRMRRILVILFLIPLFLQLLWGHWLTGIEMILELLVIAYVIVRMLRPTHLGGTMPVLRGRAPFTEIEADVRGFAGAYGLDPDTIAIRLDPRDFGSSPCVRQARAPGWRRQAEVYVNLPMGFLKIYASHPEEARAILAHEIAHLRQRDWQLWALFSGFLTILKWFELPLAMVLMLFALGNIVDAGVLGQTAWIASDNERDYAISDANLQSQRAALDAGTGDGIGNGGMGTAMVGKTPDELISESQERVVLALIVSTGILLMGGSRVLVIRIISRRRFVSEEMADWAASMVTSSNAVASAIRLMGGGPSRWNLFACHPTNRARLQALGIDPDETESRTPLRARLVSLRGQVGDAVSKLSGNALHKLFGLERGRLVWQRLLVLPICLLMSAGCLEITRILVTTNAINPLASGESLILNDPTLTEQAHQYWDNLTGALTYLRPAELVGYPWTPAFAVILLVSLALIRQDVGAIILVVVLKAAASPFVSAMILGGKPKFDATSFISLAGYDLGFLVPLGIALNRRMTLGKALVCAVLASAAVSLLIDSVNPWTWNNPYGPNLGDDVLKSAAHYVSIGTGLLVGDRIASWLSARLRRQPIQLMRQAQIEPSKKSALIL